jgi:hypothetical protein
VIVAAAVAGITAGVTGGHGPRHPARAAAPPLPAEAASTQGAKWLTGRAGRLLQAVNSGVGRLSAAERPGSPPAAAEAAGVKLAAAARAALRGPMPPVEKKLYRSALNDLRKAGSYAARGEFGKSRNRLPSGEIGITKVTAAADHPGKSVPPWR